MSDAEIIANLERQVADLLREMETIKQGCTFCRDYVSGNSGSYEAEEEGDILQRYMFDVNIPVFPCKPNKSPYVKYPSHAATISFEQIKAWRKEYPDALWGMPTGWLSNLIVLDVDCERSLAALEQKYGSLPVTRKVKSPHGLHLYFKYSPGFPSVSEFWKKIDIRSDGEYVIIPPSLGYTFENAADIADFPIELVDRIRGSK